MLKAIYVKDFITEENANITVVVKAKETMDTCDPYCRDLYTGIVKDIPKKYHNLKVIQTATSLTTGLPIIDVYAPELM